jgi:hypothetical protein
MNAAKQNLLIDFLAGLLVLGLVLTGTIIRFALPPGSGSDRILWGMTRHEWGDVHFWLAACIGVVIAVHVAFHWTWVTTMFSPKRCSDGVRQSSRRARLIAGLITVLLLAALTVGSWRISVSQVRNLRANTMSTDSNVQERGSSTHLEGNMSLAEVSVITLLPVQEIRQRLGLPDSVSDEDRLGQLSRRYGFTMAQARGRLSAESH